MNTGIVILAAGASTRLGQPKQLLQHNGVSLLRHSAQAAIASGADTTVVVTGAVDILTSLSNLNASTIYNPEWREGIASSIRHGLNALLELAPHTEQAILMVCDQPFISAALLQRLIKNNGSAYHIVACAYSATIGTPALFGQPYFKELMQLRGDEGARKIINRHLHHLATIPFPQGHIDIDTIDDYSRLKLM